MGRSNEQISAVIRQGSVRRMTVETANLWGGRFEGRPDETFAEFNNSFRFDRRLFEADVRASIAHANGLARAGVITEEEASLITGGLADLLEQCRESPDLFDTNSEDVHSFIESKLVEAIGETGKKLHTGRSRNDQVATALRLWLRDESGGLRSDLKGLQAGLLDAAERHPDAVFPGYTHLQRAQPILWPHFCLAYFEMFDRDHERLNGAMGRINVLPLGSGALAGTGFAIEREAVARELGFEAVSKNSLDTVSDRDFAVEFVNCGVLIMVHLSRLAEDLIIYASAEFGFIELSDAVSTGSSLMPQKKNPDALELIRGKAGRVFGHQTALNTMLKALPLAYNKDMQEDKEAVFDTVDTVRTCLRVARIVLDNLSVNEPRARQAAKTGYLNATELADYLVKKGVPFRSAHDTVGRIVLVASSQNKEIEELGLDVLQKIAPEIGDDVYAALGLENTLASKSATGGTSPGRVAEALKTARRRLST